MNWHHNKYNKLVKWALTLSLIGTNLFDLSLFIVYFRFRIEIVPVKMLMNFIELVLVDGVPMKKHLIVFLLDIIIINFELFSKNINE